MSNRTLKHASRIMLGAFTACAAGLANAAPSKFNMPPGVTEISRDVYDLHMLILWICVAIGVVVFGAMIWSIIRHRKSVGHQPAHFHENTVVEVVWTVIPFLILVGMAVPAAKTLVKMEDMAEAELTVKVTGYQWRWHYDYIDDGFSYFSNLAQSSNEARQRGAGIDLTTVDNYLLDVDNPVVVPVGKKIRFLLTANDVIHAWWIPQLAIKKDAVPGFVTEIWTRIDEAGTYRGQCAELCGRDHGFMPVVLIAKSQEDYDAWVADRKADAEAEAAALATDRDWSLDELMERGEGVYMSQCAACHQPNGQGLPAAGFPSFAGTGLAVDPDGLAAHIDMVLNGSQANAAMAAFGNTLNDLDLAAVITYERNAWGNDTGDIVQPRDIKSARGQ